MFTWLYLSQSSAASNGNVQGNPANTHYENMQPQEVFVDYITQYIMQVDLTCNLDFRYKKNPKLTVIQVPRSKEVGGYRAHCSRIVHCVLFADRL